MSDNKPRKKSQPLEELFVTTNVPAWMQPPKQDTSTLYTEWTWEEILRRVSEGQFLTHICKDPTMPQDYGRLLRWIMNDDSRKADYYHAQSIGTEMMVENALEVSEGAESAEDVQRSKLRVDTIKWVVGARNRVRYGDIKQVEQTVKIDISDAMSKAQQRVIDLRKPVLIEQDVNNG